MDKNAYMSVEVKVCCGPGLSQVQAVFPALRSETKGTTLVAWLDGQPVGHIQVHWSGSAHEVVKNSLGDVPEIRRLRVEPSARRCGVASALLGAAEEMVADHGFGVVGLAVGLANEDAMWLYKRNGYVNPGLGSFESANGLDEFGNRYRHLVTYFIKQVANIGDERVVA